MELCRMTALKRNNSIFFLLPFLRFHPMRLFKAYFSQCCSLLSLFYCVWVLAGHTGHRRTADEKRTKEQTTLRMNNALSTMIYLDADHFTPWLPKCFPLLGFPLFFWLPFTPPLLTLAFPSSLFQLWAVWCRSVPSWPAALETKWGVLSRCWHLDVP